MVSYCPNCTARLTNNAASCNSCGANLEKSGHWQVPLQARGPDAKRSHSFAAFFSVPVALVTLAVVTGNVSESANNLFVVFIICVIIVSLPWSVVAVIMYLAAVPIHSGLHPEMDGYSWRSLVAYLAPALIVAGAHFNFYLVSGVVSRLSRKSEIH